MCTEQLPIGYLGRVDMASDEIEWEADADARVQRQPTVGGIGKVPAAVFVRAEQLCRLLDEAAEARPDRQFLVAALIATAPADAAELTKRLKRYRGQTTRDVLLNEDVPAGKVDLRKELEDAQRDVE